MSRRSIQAISKVGQRRQVVLPSSVCERLGLQIGDYVQFVVRGSDILVQPRRLAPLSEQDGSLAHSLPPAPSRQERRRLLTLLPTGGGGISLELVRSSRTTAPPPAPFNDKE